MATTPHHEHAARNRPGKPQHGTTALNGGAQASRPRRPIPLQVARIDTLAMTDDELDAAAEALAVLLNRFRQAHPGLAA
ncbi:hypothetical protein Daura_03825 [Dactylosporangium aurantiacum]|uniref:Uncharacterized protein n=1 Tax=Dactylosporangium aurantiacum TaxID=35754 RepID=A0A9Q9IGY9_9ACTN|nr:hypothetical protein [Dactylosporangium aurantiacum]MDG6100513.1 hypothetical protein [Dactylosporangium aurantiacum]UWZ55386.1 hypothetical protein Daura_03825 [Dactylosporangium aurantiacum]